MIESDVRSAIISAVCKKLNTHLIDPKIQEIGDGNINRVFRVTDDNLGQSLIVKYAPESAIILPSIKLKRDRGLREGKYLSLVEKILPGTMPKVYGYDEEQCVLIIEDFGDVKTLADSIIEGKCSRFDAEKLACFVADTCFFSSEYTDISMIDPDESIFDFSDLCLLTQNLVLEQPYYDHPNNHFTNGNELFVKTVVYDNAELIEKVSVLKDTFLNSHQAIIHGDLHFASIFDLKNDIRIFDGEFAYNGPIGFDLGNVIAHLLMSYLRCEVLKTERKVFDSKSDIFAEGIWKFLIIFSNRFSQLLSKYGKSDIFDLQQTEIIKSIISNSYGFAGTECLRRVIGLAKSPIFTKDLSLYERRAIERCLILAGVSLVCDDISLLSKQDVIDFCSCIFKKGMKLT